MLYTAPQAPPAAQAISRHRSDVESRPRRENQQTRAAAASFGGCSRPIEAPIAMIVMDRPAEATLWPVSISPLPAQIVPLRPPPELPV